MSTDTMPEQDQRKSQPEGGLSRRAMLLTGASTLAAAGMLSEGRITSAQA
jgi:hypothetical protein